MLPTQLLDLSLSREEIRAQWEGRPPCAWSSWLVTKFDRITLSHVFGEYATLTELLPGYLGHITSPRDLLRLIPEFERYAKRLSQ